MIFLGPLYRLVVEQYAAHINHFPLIRLIFYSVDKTMLYFLFFLIIRWLFIVRRHLQLRRWSFWRHELLLYLFVFYLMLLYALTVFRGIYFPKQLVAHLALPRGEINLRPFVETMKLTQGQSMVDFIYNLYGNILWFIPFGLGLGVITRKKNWLLSLIPVVLFSAIVSLSIETCQYFLSTGIADIDDLIFNTIGGLLGFCVYGVWRLVRSIWR
ncbi:VanZ family protein [Loigolactobacillus iwatensis]|uniref:VanZ family protein n=1 Tax=Loigolactobacillus iwatensis TaxID=1267156 RepID=UPI000F7E79C0|nr:VanZ family protein [Loigolactobacillus iwatensis]